MFEGIRTKLEEIYNRYPKLQIFFANAKAFSIRHRRILIVIGMISFLIACIEVPREIYRTVMNHNYYHDLGNRDYWPVHDYYGNNVNIFEFENFLVDCGAEDIIKGFYYKENGNTAICYDFHVGDTRILLDNEIKKCSSNYYSINVSSDLSVYEGDRIYRTEVLSGTDYVMDYRSPMWVERRIFNLLHDMMDSFQKGTYDGQSCPFEGRGVAHYDESETGFNQWHIDY